MPPNPEQLEQIVAYLDGELSPEESAQVERQLAADETFRQELQGAERAWTALDQLPLAAVGDEFSRTTMEMVVDAARNDVQAKTMALPVQQRRSKLTTALLGLMAVLLGALAVRVVANSPNRRLIADLPVIQNVDIYTQFRDIEFLRQLERGLDEASPPSAAEAQQLESRMAEYTLVSTLDRRQDWIDSLQDEQQVTLRAQFNRFRDLPPRRHAELRALHEQINSAEDRDQLLTTMFRYEQWLVGLPASEQYEMRELPPEEQAPRIARRMRQDASQQKFELSPEQLEALLAVVRPYFEEAAKQRLRDMPRQERDEARRWSDPRRMREIFYGLLKTDRLSELNQAILEVLPTPVRQEFEQLSPWERGPILMNWLRQARLQSSKDRRMGGRPHEPTEQELADFFVELNTEDKQLLLALPRDQMQQRLKRLYRGNLPERWGPQPPEWDRPGPPPHRDPEGRRRDRRDDSRRPGPPRRPPRGDRPPPRE